MSGRLSRWRAIAGLASQQLRHERLRTTMAILGVTLAVLAMTLLASTGFGVLETGSEKFESSGRDLWVTGGPIQFAPGTVGGFENTILDSHAIAANLSRIEDVKTAVPLAFQTVYASPTPNDFETIIGVGVPGTGQGGIQMSKGKPFVGDDVHYAGGNYSGPMTHEIIIDQNTAETYNLSINDTLYVGGSIASARANEFTVIGISPTFSRFLGTSTVTLRLSELQEVTGTTRTDRATMLTISLDEGAAVQDVESRIQDRYPRLDVRTNQEQLQAVLQGQLVVIASGLTLVVLAIVAGIALNVNLMALLVYQHRREIAAAKALGVSSGILVGMVTGQAIAIGLIGGLLGILLTPPGALLLNHIAATIVGFEGLVQVPVLAYVGAAGISIVMGVVGAVVAGYRVTKLNPATELRR